MVRLAGPAIEGIWVGGPHIRWIDSDTKNIIYLFGI